MIKNDLELYKKYNNELIRKNLSIDFFSDKSEESLEYNYNKLIERLKELIGDKYAE